MRIKADKLNQVLQKSLLPIYLLYGQEVLLKQEAEDLIRHRAKQSGFDAFETMTVRINSDWKRLEQLDFSPGLFAEKKIIFVYLEQKLNKTNQQVLLELSERVSQEIMLVLSIDKLDMRVLNSLWVKAIDKIGVVVSILPVSNQQLPHWITERVHARGLAITPDAAALLSELVVGNLLSAHQEIEKLVLLQIEKKITREDIQSACSDNARYTIFECVDAALAQKVQCAEKMLKQLRLEGAEPVLILWAIAKELRELAKMSYEISEGESVGQVLGSHRVWQQKKPFYQRRLEERSYSYWHAALKQAQITDCCIKGQAVGDIWLNLLMLLLTLSGLETTDKCYRDCFS